ncbi:putative helicase [Actinoplanes sp. N902-109]|nr:putative helicase [Actinoplanes sp. N902-109]
MNSSTGSSVPADLALAALDEDAILGLDWRANGLLSGLELGVQRE